MFHQSVQILVSNCVVKQGRGEHTSASSVRIPRQERQAFKIDCIIGKYRTELEYCMRSMNDWVMVGRLSGQPYGTTVIDVKELCAGMVFTDFCNRRIL
jgi:hypothetical protein